MLHPSNVHHSKELTKARITCEVKGCGVKRVSKLLKDKTQFQFQAPYCWHTVTLIKGLLPQNPLLQSAVTSCEFTKVSLLVSISLLYRSEIVSNFDQSSFQNLDATVIKISKKNYKMIRIVSHICATCLLCNNQFNGFTK